MFKKMIVVGLLMIGLVGCSLHIAEQVLTPVDYTKPVSIHTNKNATLVLQTGEVIAQDSGHAEPAANSGIISALIVKGVDSYESKKHPSQYRYAYDQRQQNVFMESLKSALEKNHVFKTVQIATEQPQSSLGNPVIIVKFTRTVVGSQYRFYPITLVVDLQINEGARVYKRHIFVRSRQITKLFDGSTFMKRQIEVTNKLLDKVMNALKMWAK